MTMLCTLPRKTISTNTAHTIGCTDTGECWLARVSLVRSLPLCLSHNLAAWHACNRCPSGIHCVNRHGKRYLTDWHSHSLHPFLPFFFLSTSFSTVFSHFALKKEDQPSQLVIFVERNWSILRNTLEFLKKKCCLDLDYKQSHSFL